MMKPSELRRRGDKMKAANAALRARVAELERQMEETRRAAFAAGSADTLHACYAALGDDGAVALSQALVANRGRKSLLTPEIERMLRDADRELFKQAGVQK